jgi:hypothetical protein
MVVGALKYINGGGGTEIVAADLDYVQVWG